jgi:hypothetical protein
MKDQIKQATERTRNAILKSLEARATKNTLKQFKPLRTA